MDAFHAHLETQKLKLQAQKILAGDRELWQDKVLPRMLHCLELLQGSTVAAKAYAQSREENHLAAFKQLLLDCQRLKEDTASRLGLLSQETQEQLKEISPSLSNSNEVQQYTQGEASEKISLFDD